MSKKNSRIEDSRDFFEKKFKLKLLIEDFEKRIYQANSLLDSAFELVEEMECIASKRKAYYFLNRTRKFKFQFKNIQEKKGYKKKEFDFLYKILEKINENESSDFLNSILKGQIEKLAIKMSSDEGEQSLLSTNKVHKKYFTFTFRGVHFISENIPMKIIRNVNHTKSNVRIGKIKFPIYPGPNFGISPSIDEITDPTHLCILKLAPKSKDLGTENKTTMDYRCFFFHNMDKEFWFNESTVKSRLKPVEEGVSPYIKSYFRYAGQNFYWIEAIKR